MGIMSTSQEIAERQTRNVCLWLDNDEPSYDVCIDRLERRGLFTRAGDVKEFVRIMWGDKTPGDEGMSRVRWGEVMEFMNCGNEEWIGMRIDEIKRRNKRAGQHWFDKDTLAFFNGIVYPNTRTVKSDENGLNVGTLFVSSERFGGLLIPSDVDNSPRLYSVRMYRHDNHQVDTIGVFQGYLTLDKALRVMRNYRLGDEPLPECDPSVLNSSSSFDDFDRILGTIKNATEVVSQTGNELIMCSSDDVLAQVRDLLTGLGL